MEGVFTKAPGLQRDYPDLMEGVFTKAPGLQRDYPDLTGERKGHVRISHDESCEEFARCLAAELQKMYYNAIIISPDSLGAESEQIKDQILHHSSLGLFVLSDSFFRNERCLSDVVDFCQKTQVPKLSLFYKLSKFEFKDEKGRELWRETWSCWKEGNDNMANWEQAAELLGSWDGIEYSTQASNIMHYVQTVAEAVCHCVPLQVYWSKESSQVQGKKPMCEKVDALFESKASLINGGTQVLGVHGIWGVGKSTLGKVLLDFYSPEFGGRVCYMQLGPTPLPDSYGVRLHRQKRILLELFEASATFVDWRVRDLGQANAYLDYCLGQAFKKVFLVVDNIQDSMQSFEEARDLFMRKVPFPRGSKVLLLARSLHTLRGLLQPLENSSSDTVVQFPSHLLFDGCDQIFRQALESGLSKSAVEKLYKECDKDDIFRYFFPAYCRSHHPLTIKSLAAFAQSRGSVFGGVPQFQSKHSDPHQEKPLPTTIAWENNVKICILIKNEGLLENVFETLQKGYKLLNSKEQQFFLDVALYMPSTNIHRLRRLHDSSDELFSTTSKCLRKLRDEAFLIYKGREVHMPAVCRCFADQMVQRELSAQMMHIARETVQLALIRNNFVKASHFYSLQRIAFESCHFVQGDNFASNYFFLDLSGCKLLSLLRLWGNRSEKMIEVLLGTCYMLKSLEIQCNTSPIVVRGDCRYVECFKGDYSTRGGPWSLLDTKMSERLEVLEVFMPIQLCDLSHFEQCNNLHVLRLHSQVSYDLCTNGYTSRGGKWEILGGVIDLRHWINLRELVVEDVRKLRLLTGFELLRNLRVLHLGGLNDLEDLAGIEELNKLEEFHLLECSLCFLNLPGSSWLRHCCIYRCGNLRWIRVKSKLVQKIWIYEDEEEDEDELEVNEENRLWLQYDANMWRWSTNSQLFNPDSHVCDGEQDEHRRCFRFDTPTGSDLLPINSGDHVFKVCECPKLNYFGGLLDLTAIPVFEFSQQDNSLLEYFLFTMDTEYQNWPFSCHGYQNWPFSCHGCRISEFAIERCWGKLQLSLLEVVEVHGKRLVQELVERLQSATGLKKLAISCDDSGACGCDKNPPSFSLLSKSLRELKYGCACVRDLSSMEKLCRQLAHLDLRGCKSVERWPDFSHMATTLNLPYKNEASKNGGSADRPRK